MNASAPVKMLILALVTLAVIGASLAFAVWHHDDGDDRIQFKLIDQTGKFITQRDLSNQHLMVFFGFTSCPDICPTQMAKLSQVMTALDESGQGALIKPVFISVDPERDTPEKVAQYLTHFDARFVGLTGSRPAIKSATSSFKTVLADRPPSTDNNYQLTHASVVYIVDPLGRVVDYVSGSADAQTMVTQIRDII